MDKLANSEAITGAGLLGAAGLMGDTAYNALRARGFTDEYIKQLDAYLDWSKRHGGATDPKQFLRVLDSYADSAQGMMQSRFMGVPVKHVLGRVPISGILEHPIQDVLNFAIGRHSKVPADRLFKLKDSASHYVGAAENARDLFAREILTHQAREGVPANREARKLFSDAEVNKMLKSDKSLVDRFKVYFDRLNKGGYDHLSSRDKQGPFIIRDRALLRGNSDITTREGFERAQSWGVRGYGSRVRRLAPALAAVSGLGALTVGGYGANKLINSLRKPKSESLTDKLKGLLKTSSEKTAAIRLLVPQRLAASFNRNEDIIRNHVRTILDNPSRAGRFTPKALENMLSRINEFEDRKSLLLPFLLNVRRGGRGAALASSEKARDYVKYLDVLEEAARRAGRDPEKLRGAIVGPWGSGKTSLSNDLSRFYKTRELDPELVGGSSLHALDRLEDGVFYDQTGLLHEFAPRNLDLIAMPTSAGTPGAYNKQVLMRRMRDRMHALKKRNFSEEEITRATNMYDNVDFDRFNRSFKEIVDNELDLIGNVGDTAFYAPRRDVKVFPNRGVDRSLEIARRSGLDSASTRKNPLEYYERGN